MHCTSIGVNRSALVIEKYHSMTGGLTNSGFTFLRHGHTSVHTGMTTHLSKDIEQGKYDLIWVEF